MMTENERKILRWIGEGRGVGLSSKTIALTTLDEMPSSPHYPHDPDDFSRCRRLLADLPFTRRGLAKLGIDGGRVWKALVKRWDEIDAQFEESERGGWKDDGKCYRLMRSIIDPAERQHRSRAPVGTASGGGV